MAARNLLTDTAIRKVKLTTNETMLNDGDGLALRCRITGGRDWLFVYKRTSGEKIKLGLGSYPSTTLANARDKAEVLRGQRAAGQDPKALREAAEAAKQAAQQESTVPATFEDLFKYWKENCLTRPDRSGRMRRKDGGASIEYAFRLDAFPKIGSLPLGSIRKKHIASILDAILKRGANRSANMMLSELRQCFRYAVSRDFMEIEPTASLSKLDFGGQDKTRDRTLSTVEIVELKSRLPDAHMSKHCEAALWLMLATACRVGELSLAKWSEVDLKAAVWNIPTENSKNEHAHLVHLSAFAVQWFAELQAMKMSDTWVLPNRDSSGPLCTKTIQKQIRDRQRTGAMHGRSKQTGTLLLSGGEWTAHDLRRTASTLMGDLGVRPDVIDRCQNHFLGSSLVRRAYQQHEYTDEMRKAWGVLGERLDALMKDAMVKREAAGKPPLGQQFASAQQGHED